VPLLVEALDDRTRLGPESEKVVALMAADGLALLGDKAISAIPKLKELTSSKDTELVVSACAALWEAALHSDAASRESVFQVLTELAADRKREKPIRMASLQLLLSDMMYLPSTLPPVMPLLKEKRLRGSGSGLHMPILRAVADLGPEAADLLPQLMDFVKQPIDPNDQGDIVREKSHALRAIKAIGPKAKVLIPQLIDYQSNITHVILKQEISDLIACLE
jgi:hypothetical protein